MPASVTRARTLVRTIFDGDQARAISRTEPAMLSPTEPLRPLAVRHGALPDRLCAHNCVSGHGYGVWVATNNNETPRSQCPRKMSYCTSALRARAT